MKNSLRLIASIMLLLGCASCASQQQRTVSVASHFQASLSGSQVVLPVSGSGEGLANFQFNSATKVLTWTITYSGLSTPALVVDLHGPAKRGVNSSTIINLSSSQSTQSPVSGSATLSNEQVSELATGMTYIDIHTEQNPNGEIRGQVLPQTR